MKNSFTEGKIDGPLVRFAFPVLAALFLQSLYGAVDLLVVGRFTDATQVSAVSTGSQIMMSITNLIAALSMGTTVMLGHQIGQKRREDAGYTIGASIVLFGMIGIILSGVMIFASPALSSIMQAPAEAYDATVAYVRICGGGMAVIVAYNLIGGIFRGIGDSTTPLIAVAIAAVGNMIGDLLLVAGLHMGASGAAIATVGSQLLSVVLSFVMISKKEHPFTFRRNMIRRDGRIMAQVVKIGLPIALQDLLVSISFMVIMAIVNSLGVVASAGVGVAGKVTGFIMLVPSAFSQSLAAFVSQNHGAQKMERADKGLAYGIMTSLAIGVFMAYFSFFHGDLLAGIFTRETEVISASWDYMKAYAIDCMLTPIFFCFIGYYNGIRKTRFVMMQGILSAFLVRVPFSWFMSRQVPVSLFHIGLATPAASSLQIIMCLAYFRYLKTHASEEHHMTAGRDL